MVHGVARRYVLGAALVYFSLGAGGEPPVSPELDPEAVLGHERDVLISRIAQGEDLAESVSAFQKLLQRRTQLLIAAKEKADRDRKEEEARRAAELAAAEAQRRAEEQRKEQEKQEAEAEKQRQATRRDYLNSLDHLASRHCYLSVDPQKRHFKGGVSADWGQVVGKTAVEIPPKNALADPQVVTMYEIAGVSAHHFLREDHRGKLKAGVGDLIFLCHPYGNSDRHLPPPWDKVPLVSPNENGRLAKPPLIAKKGKWNPIHVTLNDLFWAIKEVKWKFPEDRYVLAHLMVGEELERGRFSIAADDAAVTFVLEVPPGLPQRELLKKEEWVWVIMGHPRFDPQLKKLVLIAADIESRYLIEPP